MACNFRAIIHFSIFRFALNFTWLRSMLRRIVRRFFFYRPDGSGEVRISDLQIMLLRDGPAVADPITNDVDRKLIR
ncbi:MAG TPA: hypothetical protein VGG19_20615 [Tepidisphaeraceae bacterium]